jgi:hypothetical protein
VICEIATLELPVLVMMMFWAAEEVPVVTLPKLRLVGAMPRVKVAAIPVPLTLTEVGEVGALLTMEMLPDAAPIDVGRKATVIVACCPTLTFKGSENPLTVKPAPDSIT